MDGWWTVQNAPNYEITSEGHIRYKGTTRCLKHLNDDPEGDGPYVRLRINGKTVRRRVQDLLLDTGLVGGL